LCARRRAAAPRLGGGHAARKHRGDQRRRRNQKSNRSNHQVIRPAYRHRLIDPRISGNVAFQSLERLDPMRESRSARAAERSLWLLVPGSNLGCADRGNLCIAANRTRSVAPPPGRSSSRHCIRNQPVLDDASVRHGIVQPPHPIPAAAQGPLTRDINLVSWFAQIAITHAQGPEQFRLIPHADGEALGPIIAPVVLQRALRGPFLSQPPGQRSQPIGAVIGPRRCLLGPGSPAGP